MNWEKFNFVNGVTIFDSDKIVTRWGIDLYKERNLLPTINKLCVYWKVPYNEIIDFIIKNQLEKHLFDYSIYDKGTLSKLVYENGTYRIDYVYKQGKYVEEKTWFNIYVVENKYISLLLPKIIEYIIEVYYQHFAIYEVKEKYPNIKINEDTYIEDIAKTYYKNDFKVKDILAIIKGEPILEMKLTYKIYSDYKYIYLPIKTINIHNTEYDLSLIVPTLAIINRDWSLVENVYVHNIIKANADSRLGENPDNWYNGTQINAPYWSEPQVQELKALFHNS